MHPLMIVLMLAGGHSMMNGHGHRPAKVPTAVIDVRTQVCPVKEGKPLPEIATLRRNRVYHFCSRECLEAFNKNPRPLLRKIKNPLEVALRTVNSDGIDPASKHSINARKNPPFLVRGDTITFYATIDTVGKDSAHLRKDGTSDSQHSSHKPDGAKSSSHSGDPEGHSMMCH